MIQFKTSFKTSAVGIAVGLALSMMPMPSSATLADDIETAESGSSDEVTEPQSELQVAKADLDEITDRLKALNSEVVKGEATKKRIAANRKVLEDQASTYDVDIEKLQKKIDALEIELSEQAGDLFKEGGERSALSGIDPDSLRKRGLSRKAIRSRIEIAEDLRQAKADLKAKEQGKEELAENLDLEASGNDANLQKYDSARSSLVEVAEEAEERAQRTLFEAEGLDSIDKTKADALRKSVAALEEQVGLALKDKIAKEEAEAKANPGKEYVSDGSFPTEADMVDAGNGINVHKEIASDVRRMLKAAEADGVLLQSINGTGGFRSHARQIELRRQHCGSSNYDIYKKKSSLCIPPTATPGNSMHEQGKAIDFSNKFGAITRNSPEFRWLTEHAATYGFKNLPSESWHWSINGR